MTVSIPPRPGGDDRLARLALAAGHYENKAFIALAAMFVASDACGDPQSGPLYWLTLPFVVVWAVGAWSAIAGPHRRQLCERCASSAPLDPQAKVRRWAPALRLFHMRRVLYGVAAVMGVKILFLDHVFGPSAWLYALDALILAVLCVIGAAQDVHRRLAPWCPWCHWGGEGGRQEISPEVPDPAASR
jgi:hypothetical protein